MSMMISNDKLQRPKFSQLRFSSHRVMLLAVVEQKADFLFDHVTAYSHGPCRACRSTSLGQDRVCMYTAQAPALTQENTLGYCVLPWEGTLFSSCEWGVRKGRRGVGDPTTALPSAPSLLFSQDGPRHNPEQVKRKLRPMLK